jgi:uncharacterized alkaline shock family protein YloU
MSVRYALREDKGSITIEPGAMSAIVRLAAESVDGARLRGRRRSVDLEIEDRRARLDLALVARYGVALPDLARDVQTRVADALADMCGLTVETVDVTVAELEGA